MMLQMCLDLEIKPLTDVLTQNRFFDFCAWSSDLRCATITLGDVDAQNFLDIAHIWNIVDHCYCSFSLIVHLPSWI